MTLQNKIKENEMKKTFSILLVLIMLTSLLTACGGGGRPARDPAANFSEFRWPTGHLASLIPVPNSTFGRIAIDSSSQLSADVGNTSQSEFDAYVDECFNRGFNVDFARIGNDFFRAINADEYSLLLSFDDEHDIMRIILNAPREPEPEPTPAPEPETTPEPTPDAQVGQDDDDDPPPPDTQPGVDWRQWLSDYEQWVDDYIDFMERYAENPSDLSLLTEYMEFMTRLIEWTEQAAEIELDLINDPAALTAYLETMSRILQRLAEVEY
jgi:hypothetical protein